MKGQAKQILVGLTLILIAGMVRAADPVKVEDQVQLADGLFRRNMFKAASLEYARLSGEQGITNGMDVILYRLGECYRHLGQGDLALASYIRLVKVYPESRYAARSRLQSALIQLKVGTPEALEFAATLFGKLAVATQPPEVRSAALYHWGETLEKQGKDAEAIQKYEELGASFGETEYGMYSALRVAWLLLKSGDAKSRERAMGIYLDLKTKAKDPKVAEEAAFLAAKVALMEQRYEQSANLFLQLRKSFPNSPRVKESALSAAWANYYCGRYKEAVELLDLVQDDLANPQREEILYLKANCLRQLEQRGQAGAVYATLLKDFPRGEYADRAWQEQLTSYYKDGDYTNVLAVATQRTQLQNGEMDQIYWMVSDAALALGKNDVAVENCRLLVDKCPKSRFVKDSLYRLGWLLQKQEAWEAAAGWYLKIPELFPKDPVASKALYSSGLCHLQLQRGEMALRDWRNLLVAYPDSEEAPEALYQKALEEVREKDFRAAGATLDERLTRFPKDARLADVLYWRGVIYRELGDLTESEKKYRACLAANPGKELERNAKLELGALLFQMGKKDETAKIFQSLLDPAVADKVGPDRLAWLAEIQCQQKNYDAAIAAAQCLISLKPDKGWMQTAWTLEGRAYRAKGQRDAAEHAYREALKTGASTTFAAEAALRLGELLSEAGQYDEAAAHLEDAARRAASPEMIATRARAYFALANNAEKKGDDESALRLFMSVGLLFDDQELVPQSLERAIHLQESLGRPDEAGALKEELKTRYPGYKPPSEGKK